MRAGCATLLALNKWDVTATDIDDARARVERKLRLRPEVVTCSATRGRNVASLLPKALELADRAAERIPTPELNRFVADVVAKTPPPSRRGRRLRLYYAAQVGERPPRIAIQVNDRRLITRDWAYHLENRMREAYGLEGVPLVIDFVPHSAAAVARLPPMPETKPLAEGEYLFTSESVTEGHPDKVCDQISDGVLDAVMAEDPEGRVACETLVNTGMAVVSGRDLDRRPPRRARDRPRDDPRDRLRPRRLRLQLRPHLGPGLARQAVARHRPGRRRRLRDAGRRLDRRRAAARRRGRPGDDVRLRDRRDRGADADADPHRAPAGRTPRRGAQGRHARLPRPRRQDPGHRPLRRRPPGPGREAADLHPARRGRRLARRRSSPTSGSTSCCRCSAPRSPASTTRTSCARASSSTRPASS